MHPTGSHSLDGLKAGYIIWVGDDVRAIAILVSGGHYIRVLVGQPDGPSSKREEIS
jgi:hypothetical protein